MTQIQRHNTANQQHTGPTVWILSTGEMSEGGQIIGVYLDRDLAHGDFVTEAQKIHDRFGIDDLKPAEDGSIQLNGGCDWLALEPHQVTTRRELSS